jgi:hypothetical protein
MIIIIAILKPILLVLPFGNRLFIKILRFIIAYEKFWLEHYVELTKKKDYYEIKDMISSNFLCPENLGLVFEEYMMKSISSKNQLSSKLSLQLQKQLNYLKQQE